MIPSTSLLLAAALSAVQGGSPALLEDDRPEKRLGARGDVPGALVFDPPSQVDLEEIHQGGTLDQRFTFRNTGTAAVHIERGIALSGTGTVEFTPATVPPGGRGEVRVRQPVGDHLGRASFRFALVTDEPGVARYRLGLRGFVESAYDPERPRLEWAAADKGAVVHAETDLFSREVEALRVLEVIDAPPYLRLDASARAGLNAEGVRLRAALDAGRAPLGVTRGVVRLRTNVPAQPECRVSYSVNVVGDIVPSRDAVNLGLVRVGEEATADLTLTSRSGRAVEVRSASTTEVTVTIEVLPCPGDLAGPACRVLRIKHRPAERGHFAGTLEVRLAGLDEPMHIAYSGLVVSPQTRVKQIDLPNETEPERLPVSTAAPPAPAPIPSAAPVPAPSPAARPAPAASGVTLQWKARNESGIYGYLIYRGERPSGPFVRVNAKIVRAGDGNGEIRSYSFVDEDVRPGRTYYYYLDAVDGGGLKKRFTEVKAREAWPAE